MLKLPWKWLAFIGHSCLDQSLSFQLSQTLFLVMYRVQKERQANFQELLSQITPLKMCFMAIQGTSDKPLPEGILTPLEGQLPCKDIRPRTLKQSQAQGLPSPLFVSLLDILVSQNWLYPIRKNRISTSGILFDEQVPFLTVWSLQYNSANLEHNL